MRSPREVVMRSSRELTYPPAWVKRQWRRKGPWSRRHVFEVSRRIRLASASFGFFVVRSERCYSAVMSTTADVAVVAPAARVQGRITVPGDKSISHRYAILAALSHGRSVIEHYAPGADCAATAAALRMLGAASTLTQSAPVAFRRGAVEGAVADLGDYRSRTRRTSGARRAHRRRELRDDDAHAVRRDGRASVHHRPCRRCVPQPTPDASRDRSAERMGARIDSSDGRPPLRVHGARRRRSRPRPGPERAGQERGAAGRPAGRAETKPVHEPSLLAIIRSGRCRRSVSRSISTRSRVRSPSRAARRRRRSTCARQATPRPPRAGPSSRPHCPGRRSRSRR